MMDFITQHWPWFLCAFIVYSTAVDSMEEPRPSDGKFYRWLYRFAHGLAFNLVTAFGKIGRTPWIGEIPGHEGFEPGAPRPPDKP